MSSNYKHGDRIPSEVYTARLYELAQYVADGPDAVRRNFDMRIPAERDRDADLVLSGAARRITELEQRLKVLQDAITDALEGTVMDEHGNRNDDGLEAFFRREHAEGSIKILRAAMRECAEDNGEVEDE